MCYYGHVENTSNLGHDLYMSFVFGALVEIPAYSVYWLVDRFGRRPVIFAAAVGSGAASVAYGFLPGDMSALRSGGRMYKNTSRLASIFGERMRWVDFSIKTYLYYFLKQEQFLLFVH